MDHQIESTEAEAPPSPDAAPADAPAPAAPPAIRVRGRSFMALVLTPDAPLADWLGALDAAIARAASFFVARPVVLDLGLLRADTPCLADLPEALRARGIRVIGTENNACAADVPDLPPSLSGGRETGEETVPEDAPADDGGAADETGTGAPAAAVGSLVIDGNVRSGRQVIFEGDLTVVGSVASGAEVLAGGSVHVYGSLRGRAIAGFGGRPDARILCRKLEAELIAIDGFYLTAEDMDPAVLGGPAQAFLSDERITLRRLD